MSEGTAPSSVDNIINVNKYIDHTVLKPTTTEPDVSELCHQAYKYDFAAVCVPPNFVSFAKTYLKESSVNIATVIGFPFGYSCIGAKAKETEQAIVDGANEIDMVANISAIKSKNEMVLRQELKAIQEAIRSTAPKGSDVALKVIIESGILTDEEIIMCCKLYGAGGINYLKTSTGYAEKGASLHAVRLFREHLPSSVKIKASGGIRTYAATVEMIEAGADRIGCSAGVAIVTEQSEMLRKAKAMSTRSSVKSKRTQESDASVAESVMTDSTAASTTTPAGKSSSRTPSRSQRAVSGSFANALSAFKEREGRVGSKRSNGDTDSVPSRGGTPAAKRVKTVADEY